jgi:cation:H+ antiporter
MHSGLLLIGFVLLYFGAEWLVKGSGEIAYRVGISPLVVGLTVVAFGTSAPELMVSLKANLGASPEPDIALGNIIGSNICNIMLILGVGALVRPIVVHGQIIKREVPILLVATLVFFGMLWDGTVNRVEGGVLFAGIIFYVVASVRMAKKEPQPSQYDEAEAEQIKIVKRSGPGRVVLDLGLILIGLAGLVLGAHLLVGSGVFLAEDFGVPSAIIGLTLVAFGTSLPELATAVVAARRNQGDIITGAAIGSSIFNILCVIGIASLVLPLNADKVNRVDLWVMLGATVLIIPLLATRMKISRGEGLLLLLGYVAYTVYLVVWRGVGA